MTAYYCDLGASFVNRSGADSTDNVLTGPGGFQAKLLGTGLATPALAAGDILYLKGTADLSKFVTMTCGKDVTGWDLGDSVRNDTGDGDHWTGKVCQLNVGATTRIRVQLDTGDYAAANGNKGDGIENTTKSDTTTLTTVANDGLDCGTASGTAANGYIKIIGCDSSFTPYAAQAVLDGNSGSVSCIRYTNSSNYYWWQNVTFKRATGDGLYRAGTQPEGWVLIDCIIELNGGDGVGDYLNHAIYYRCIIRNNTVKGLSATYGCTRIVACWIYANGTGIASATANGYFTVSVGNVVVLNVNDQLGTGSIGLVMNCVVDGENDATSGHGIVAGLAGNFIIGNRITHNDASSKNGIDSSATAGKLVVADWNAFFDNTADMDSDVQDLGHNDTSMSDDGYADRGSLDYNVKDGADGRSEPIEINWSA